MCTAGIIELFPTAGKVEMVEKIPYLHYESSAKVQLLKAALLTGRWNENLSLLIANY